MEYKVTPSVPDFVIEFYTSIVEMFRIYRTGNAYQRVQQGKYILLCCSDVQI